MLVTVTPIPPIDPHQVELFWQRAVASGIVDPSAPVPSIIEPFGDSRELANELIALVVDGPKRATAGALASYERDGVALPCPVGCRSPPMAGGSLAPCWRRRTYGSVRCRRSTKPLPGTKARVIAPAVRGSTTTRRTCVGTLGRVTQRVRPCERGAHEAFTDHRTRPEARSLGSRNDRRARAAPRRLTCRCSCT